MQRLEKWYLVNLTQPVIIGKVFGNSKFFPGQEIMTDYIVDVDVENRILRTKTQSFKLGEPDKVWKNYFMGK